MMKFVLENDEEGLAGEPCEKWIIRRDDTNNRDIVAIIPKTGAEEYDGIVLWRIARLLEAAPELLAALEFIVNDIPSPGEDAELTACGYNLACAAIAKATGE